MNVQEFQDKLKEIQSLARRQENSLKAEQIRNTFGEAGLDEKQLAGVLKYLISQGISIEGVETAEQTKEKEERRRTPLTKEEKAYLKEYLEGLPGAGEIPEESLFRELAEGSREAARELSSRYLKEAAELAVEMNMEEIFPPDLIQEANLCLL